jgi:DNA/RNA-binding domain of Phe-tRNA-synthetase-like protein
VRIIKKEEPVPQSYEDVFKQLEQKTKEEQAKKEALQKKKQAH